MRRRTVLAGSLAVLAGARLPMPALAHAAAGTLRVASLKFGSLSWLLETIRAEGLDVKAGVKIDIVDVATNQAGPVALLSGDTEVIVSDWTWAMRQRSQGNALKFAPYSSALGALMVPKDTAIKSLADLSGKKLGVAGTSIDKSWLLLRAYARKTLGKDLNDLATPVFAAAPLITEEMRSGRIDAVLNFWTFAARLQGVGFSPLLTVAQILEALGVKPVPPLVGFIWDEKTQAAKRGALEAFFTAVAEGNAVLAKSDAAWERVRGMVKPGSEEEFAAIKSYYREGIPQAWGEAETRSAEKLMALLMEYGETELVGSGTKFDAKLFHVDRS